MSHSLSIHSLNVQLLFLSCDNFEQNSFQHSHVGFCVDITFHILWVNIEVCDDWTE